MAIQINGGEVLLTGSVILPKGNVLKLDVGPGLALEVRFIEDESGKSEVRPNAVGGLLTVTLVNLNNSLGASWKSEVGTLDGQRLELAIFVHAAGSGEQITHLLSYTLWKGRVA